MMRVAAVLAALAVGITGCAPSHQITVPTGKPVSTGAVASSPVPAAPATMPSQRASAPPPASSAVKPRVLLEPEILIGKTEAEIAEVFGEPVLRRQESPAEVWQYLTADCAVHVFFYPDEKAAGVVRHIAINGRNLENFSTLDRRQCFNDYLRAIGAEEVFLTAKTS